MLLHRRNTPYAALLALALFLIVACSDNSTKDSNNEEPSAGAFAPILHPNPNMDEVEGLSEQVANRLIEFSYRLKDRDLRGAADYVSPTIEGSSLAQGTIVSDTSLPLNSKQVIREVSEKLSPLSRDEFLASLDQTLATFTTLDYVFFKTRGAEFNQAGDRAILKMTASLIGSNHNGGRRSLYAWADAAASLADDGWVLTGFSVRKTREKECQKPLFTEVATAAGIAVDGPRIGTEGNDRFYWRGSSATDFDGDGLIDIFSSGFKRNFLYRNKGDGSFEEVAEAFQVAQPSGPTSTIFFDFDRDGDQDLLLGFVGWEEDGLPLGDSLHLLRNDGDTFVDVSQDVGLNNFRGPTFSSIVGDFDNDGWLDIYVCNYERLDAAYPDSWFAATNGSENFLLMNHKGKSFTNEAQERGIIGSYWTFAAAAADFDEDGDLDIYSVNDYGVNALFVNDGTGHFSDQAKQLGVLDCGNGMGTSWADFNGDGKLDLYVSNMSSSAGKRILRRLAAQEKAQGVQKTLYKLAAGNSIFINKGKTFQANPEALGGRSASWAWSPVIFDANLDGHDDIYVANGFISGDSLKDT